MLSEEGGYPMSKIGFFKGVILVAGLMLYLYSYSLIEGTVSTIQLLTINITFIFMIIMGTVIGEMVTKKGGKKT